jgi:hypothetical protein
MNCKHWRSRIYDLLDDGLSAAEADRVRRHMDGCAECLQFWRDETRLAERISQAASLRTLRYRGAIPSSEAPSARDHRQGPTHAVSAIPAGQDHHADFRGAWLFRHPWGAAAGAALLILGLGAFLLLRSPREIASGSTAASKDGRIEATPRIQVISVEFHGKPAKPFIYQTPKASFIWIVPSKDIGG